MRIPLGVTTALFIAVLSLAPVSDAQADDIDRYVQAQIERQHIPGLSLAIVRSGRVMKLRGYGLADVERRVPASTETVYEIGSLTKQFTSMAVMLLREQGRLALDDPLGKFLTAGIPEIWKPVTLKQLLSHTAGVPDYEEVMGYDSYRNPMTPEQVFAFVASKPLDFPSGTRWKYSNTGYFLLTLVIEKISGESYADFVTRNILIPAGMTHTRSSEPRDVIPNRSAGYEHNKVLRNRDAIQPSATGGAGMLVSTVGDMVRWASAIAQGAILKPESYALTFTDTPLADASHAGYGFGWFVTPMRGHRAFSHSGGTAGFACSFLYLPDDDVAIVVLTNSSTLNPFNFTEHFARAIVPALRYTAIADSRPEIGRLVLDYFAHRTAKEPYVFPLASELAAQVAPYWSLNIDYYKALGAPLGVELVEQNTSEGSLRYRVRYKDAARIVLVKPDAAGKISEMAASEE